jgi:hypothetical protein
MDLGHQRTGSVEDFETAFRCQEAYRLRYAVGAENQRGALRNILQIINKDGTLGLEVIDHEAVMHDFVTYINGRTESLQCAFDDGDGAVDAGTKAAGVGENNVH